MTQRVRVSTANHSAHELAQCIAQAATDKKAENVVILDLRKLDSMTDFFVVCTGDVDQHVRAIADHIQEEVRKQAGDKLLHREGRESLNWVLLDYVDVVAHVMKPAYREYYRLEDLWGDADQLRLKKEAARNKAPKPKSAAKEKTTRAPKPASHTARSAATKKPVKRAAKKADTTNRRPAKKSA